MDLGFWTGHPVRCDTVPCQSVVRADIEKPSEWLHHSLGYGHWRNQEAPSQTRRRCNQRSYLATYHDWSAAFNLNSVQGCVRHSPDDRTSDGLHGRPSDAAPTKMLNSRVCIKLSSEPSQPTVQHRAQVHPEPERIGKPLPNPSGSGSSNSQVQTSLAEQYHQADARSV